MTPDNEIELLDYQPSMIELDVLRGRFTGITYFMTTMSLSECTQQIRYLKPEEASSFSERIQRRIDEKRAEQKIFQDYLKQPGNRFFNSLVAVLMPRENTEIEYFSFRAYKTSGGTATSALGKLRILSDIDRVVVDGQHRLYALNRAQDYVQRDDYDVSLGLSEIRVPVVFVTFDEIHVHDFKSRKGELRQQVADRARKIFVDLNRGVVKADKNSLLLLDDEDFAAIAARHLIEHHPDLELYTKWDDAGMTLADADPFFTNIFLLSEFVKSLVPDDDVMQYRYDLSRKEDREAAIMDVFLSPIDDGSGKLAPDLFIRMFFDKVSFFSEWKRHMHNLGVQVPKQPSRASLKPRIRNQIAKLRKEHLLSTVAGQRAAFLAVTNAYHHFGSPSPSGNLSHALTSLSRIHEAGLYSRNHQLWTELLTRRGGKMKLTALTPASKLLEYLIRGVSVRCGPLAVLSPDEDIGTEDTLRYYGDALATLYRNGE